MDEWKCRKNEGIMKARQTASSTCRYRVTLFVHLKLETRAQLSKAETDEEKNQYIKETIKKTKNTMKKEKKKKKNDDQIS